MKPAAAKIPAPKVVSCPSCSGSVTVRAQGVSISVICRSCGSTLDVASEEVKILVKAAAPLEIEPLIPLGSRGKLHGTVWELIGFLNKSDGTGSFFWREYLLFNPIKGFRWLTEQDGHWQYVIPAHTKPSGKPGDVSLTHLGKSYKLFHEGYAKVTFVVGEFYWRVYVDEKARVHDYISPPSLMTCESTKTEVQWMLAEYIEPEAVRAAFVIDKPMPERVGVAPNQLSKVGPMARGLTWKALLFAFAVFVVQMGTLVSADSDRVFKQSFTYVPGSTERTQVSAPFELKGGTSAIEIWLVSQVQNNWLEIEGTLVNEAKGLKIGFQQGVEFYEGSDYHGYWREGSWKSSLVIPAVPSGTYHLILNPTAGASTPSGLPGRTPQTEHTYEVTVVHDVPLWLNFWVVLGLLAVLPLIVRLRSWTFEMKRWSNSDFSPYWSHQESDE